MRRITKRNDSPILTEGLMYISGNAENNRVIREMLLTEQGNICCYTEIYLGRAVKTEVDHFNPLLKDTDQDNYNNWFAVSGQWNNEKLSKWRAFQPVLLPTSADLEQKIIYDHGDYLVANANDIETKNLYELLNIGDPDLADQRKRYIRRIIDDIDISGKPVDQFFDELLNQYPEGVYFIRALNEELGYVHPAY